MSDVTSNFTSKLAPVIFDNRFRQRRIDVAKDAGRRRLHRLLWVVAFALVALVSIVVIDSALLDIDEITVSGSPHADVDQLLSAAGVARGDALVTLDLGAVERRLEAMPWVDAAAVERDLPGSLSISITERVPTTLVTAGDSAALIDGSGRILSVGETTALTSDFAAAAPDGPAPVAVRATSVDALVPGQEVAGEFALATGLATRLTDEPAGAVAAVVVDDDSGLSLELHGGGTVVLGDTTDLDQKIEAFRTMFARVDLECLSTLDLRVSTRPVLTRDNACS